MDLLYRNEKNAKAMASVFNKQLDDNKKPYVLNKQTGETTEVFITDVLGWPWNDINQLVKDLSEIETDNILIRINSPGGDIIDCLSAYNALISHKSKIITRNEALAASAASILMLAGKERQAYKNSLAMIHEPWMLMAGNQHDFREMAGLLEKINNNLIDIYASCTSIGKREWREKLAKGETWWNATEMKENGFIDTIIDKKAVKAQFDLSMFNNVPNNTDILGTSIRDKEKALREVGFSDKEAKTILARWKSGTLDEREVNPEDKANKEIKKDNSEIIQLLNKRTSLFT